MQALVNAAPGSTIQFQVRGTNARVYWFRSAGDSFNVQVDTEDPITVDTTGAAAVMFTELDLGTSGEHTLTIASDTGVGIYGVSAENDTGIVVNNFAQGGAVATNMDLQTAGEGLEAGRWSGGQSYPSDLIIYGFQVNDATIGAVSTTAMRRYFDHVRETTDVDLLLMVKHPGSLDDATLRFQDYSNMVESIARTYGAACVNLWTIYNNNYRTFADADGWGDDTLGTGEPGESAAHPGDIGHQLWADIITPIVNGTDARFDFA
jgi:hypothetical protein